MFLNTHPKNPCLKPRSGVLLRSNMKEDRTLAVVCDDEIAISYMQFYLFSYRTF